MYIFSDHTITSVTQTDCVGILWLGRGKMCTRGLSFPYFTRLAYEEHGLRQTFSCLVLSVESSQVTATFLGLFFHATSSSGLDWLN